MLNRDEEAARGDGFFVELEVSSSRRTQPSSAFITSLIPSAFAASSSRSG